MQRYRAKLKILELDGFGKARECRVQKSFAREDCLVRTRSLNVLC